MLAYTISKSLSTHVPVKNCIWLLLICDYTSVISKGRFIKFEVQYFLEGISVFIVILMVVKPGLGKV